MLSKEEVWGKINQLTKEINEFTAEVQTKQQYILKAQGAIEVLKQVIAEDAKFDAVDTIRNLENEIIESDSGGQVQ